MKKILIVEDDKKIRGELSTFISKNGYVCEVLDDFNNVVEGIMSKEIDLVL